MPVAIVARHELPTSLAFTNRSVRFAVLQSVCPLRNMKSASSDNLAISALRAFRRMKQGVPCAQSDWIKRVVRKRTALSPG